MNDAKRFGPITGPDASQVDQGAQPRVRSGRARSLGIHHAIAEFGRLAGGADP
jgi:hypothetical protein